jgi:5-hydroxyisourate hydrolase
MISISTHILNTNLGKPATAMLVRLENLNDENNWVEIGKKESNENGRVEDFSTENSQLKTGLYRLEFDTEKYFSSMGQDSFYPTISITFEIKNSEQHYHVPLLLNNYGYTTYRGS